MPPKNGYIILFYPKLPEESDLCIGKFNTKQQNSIFKKIRKVIVPFFKWLDDLCVRNDIDMIFRHVLLFERHDFGCFVEVSHYHNHT